MVEVTIDLRDVKACAAQYAFAAIEAPKAVMRALNWTGNKARTQAARAVAKAAGLGYGKTRSLLTTKPATLGNLVYEIDATGSPIALAEFGAKQTKGGVSAAPWGQRRVFPHTFIVPKLGGQVFVRTGAARFPIRKLWGPSIPKELVKDAVTAPILQSAGEDFAARLPHELERIFGPKPTGAAT